MRADGKLICLCIFTKDHYSIPVGAVQQTWCEQSSYACTYSCKITIQSENPLPRYVSGQKYVTDGRTEGQTERLWTDGQRQNNIPPRNLSAGDNYI